MCSPCSVNAPCHAESRSDRGCRTHRHVPRPGVACSAPWNAVPCVHAVCMRCACGVHALSVLCACRVHAMRIPCAGYAFCYVREVKYVGVCELAGGSCVINNNTAFRVRVQSVLCECRRTPCCAASRSGLRVCRTCRGPRSHPPGMRGGRVHAVHVHAVCMRCAVRCACCVRAVCTRCACRMRPCAAHKSQDSRVRTVAPRAKRKPNVK